MNMKKNLENLSMTCKNSRKLLQTLTTGREKLIVRLIASKPYESYKKKRRKHAD